MDRSRALALVLRLTAVAFVVVFTLLFLASATRTDTPEVLYRLFAWGHVGDAEEQMLAVVYVVWGGCLWVAARAPQQHRLFIDFTIIANLAHAAVMAVQSFTYDGEHAHLWGDVVILVVVMGVLAALWLPVRNQPAT
jgi:hypothetical protein